MDENLKLTIQKIRMLSEQNEEFRNEMQKLFGNSVSASVVNVIPDITNNISAIRSALEIRANVSISYSFVKHQRLRDQLIIDNLRMENAALNLQDPEEGRFYIFCVNAFYQVENIVNYFYHTIFPDIKKLSQEIEDSTMYENNDFKYQRTGREVTVSSIPIAHKINAFFNSYLPNERSLKWSIGTLRQVRNEGEHRCDIIRKEKDDNNNLYKFFKSQTFNSLRGELIKFVNAVEEKIKRPIKVPVSIEKIQSFIKSKLPSACYVLFRDDTVQLPINLFSKIKHLENNDKIVLSVVGNKIIDVGEP